MKDYLTALKLCRWHCTDGKDGNGLKKLGQFFQVLMLCSQKSPKTYYG